MDRETIINLPKKIFKFVITFKFIRGLSRFIRKVYSFIPKYDKITGINTDSLVEKYYNN